MPITLSPRRVVTLLAPVSVALLVAGCGASSRAATPASTARASAPATATATAKRAVTVTTTEYAFAPMAITAKAGKVKITLDNKGKIQHELIVLRTSQAPDALKVVTSTGRVSEAASVGEVSETAAGATKSATLTLKPGTYVYVCNIPGHYADGMRGTLTVR